MKHCKRCNIVKPLKDFHANRSRKDGKQIYCKQCCNKYSKEHYDRNTQQYAAKVKRLRKKNTLLIRELKSVPCLDCKKEYPYYVMHFDHLGEKEFTISGYGKGTATQKLLEEVSKCDVVCSNCHAERTAVRAGYSCLGSSNG